MKQSHLAYIYKSSVVTTDEDNDMIAPELQVCIPHLSLQISLLTWICDGRRLPTQRAKDGEFGDKHPKLSG